LEENSVTSRLRWVWLAACGLVAISGCGGSSYIPLSYSKSEMLETEIRDKPKLQAAVTKAVNTLFGESPNQIHVPKGSGLPDGGRRLSQQWKYEGDATSFEDPKRTYAYVDTPQGGYSLYRYHCLHCHGLSGDGNGPTAPFLFPAPRDYRRGVFKFTSTTSSKPTRDDLRRTINHGLGGTSMPAFEAQMSPKEIEQVIDYVIFLAARGETERQLVGEASTAEDKDADTTITNQVAQEAATRVFESWKEAENQVLKAVTARIPSSPESIARGRQLFLGQTKEKLECAGCHGPKAVGNGPSFIDPDIFYDVVFRGRAAEKEESYELLTAFDLVASKAEAAKGDEYVAVKELPKSVNSAKGFWPPRQIPIETLLEKLEAKGVIARDTSGGADRVKPKVKMEKFADLRAERDLWEKSLDDWDRPLRPANLNLENPYKGGRRPIDIYWRVAKGINGAKMPAHLQSFPDQPERIWDIVNFVLALPYQPELLKDASVPIPAAPPAAPAPAKVASR
jgi:mono/diheme cytochrome c family protein